MEKLISSEWSVSLDGQSKIVQGIDCIKQRIGIVLNTLKGTDPLRPTFAINVLDWIDKPVNVALPGLRKEILDALTEFMPEIKVSKIIGTLDPSNSKIDYVIHFSITNTTITDFYTQSYGLTNT